MTTLRRACFEEEEDIFRKTKRVDREVTPIHSEGLKRQSDGAARRETGERRKERGWPQCPRPLAEEAHADRGRAQKAAANDFEDRLDFSQSTWGLGICVPAAARREPGFIVSFEKPTLGGSGARGRER